MKRKKSIEPLPGDGEGHKSYSSNGSDSRQKGEATRTRFGGSLKTAVFKGNKPEVGIGSIKPEVSVAQNIKVKVEVATSVYSESWKFIRAKKLRVRSGVRTQKASSQNLGVLRGFIWRISGRVKE